MDDSSSFSSLLALVDNHLSRTRIQASDSSSEEAGMVAGLGIKIPSLNRLQNTSHSETSLPHSSGQSLALPTFGLSQSPINNILTEQIANMFKVKEKKKKEEEEEKLRKELEAMKVKEDVGRECVIDLVNALSTPFDKSLQLRNINMSGSSSTESLFEPPLVDFASEFENDINPSPEAVLPCISDLSYILRQNIPMGKCSSFGKVLISRYKTTAAPYLKKKLKSDIVRFNFNTRSPCDLIKEKLRKTGYNAYSTELGPAPSIID